MCIFFSLFSSSPSQNKHTTLGFHFSTLISSLVYIFALSEPLSFLHSAKSKSNVSRPTKLDVGSQSVVKKSDKGLRNRIGNGIKNSWANYFPFASKSERKLETSKSEPTKSAEIPDEFIVKPVHRNSAPACTYKPRSSSHTRPIYRKTSANEPELWKKSSFVSDDIKDFKSEIQFDHQRSFKEGRRRLFDQRTKSFQDEVEYRGRMPSISEKVSTPSEQAADDTLNKPKRTISTDLSPGSRPILKTSPSNASRNVLIPIDNPSHSNLSVDVSPSKPSPLVKPLSSSSFARPIARGIMKSSSLDIKEGPFILSIRRGTVEGTQLSSGSSSAFSSFSTPATSTIVSGHKSRCLTKQETIRERDHICSRVSKAIGRPINYPSPATSSPSTGFELDSSLRERQWSVDSHNATKGASQHWRWSFRRCTYLAVVRLIAV